jgi:hypothetical protein
MSGHQPFSLGGGNGSKCPKAVLTARRCFIEVRSWRCQTQRTPAGEIDRPRCLSASDTRTWPQAGCSTSTRGRFVG